MIRKTFLLEVVLLWTSVCAFAAETIQFRHINTRGNTVKAICCDNGGIFWFGTSSGLYSLPQLESRNPNAYHRNFARVDVSINSIFCDKQGLLWLKSHSNDVYRYNPAHNEFTTGAEELFKEKGIDVKHDYFSVNNEVDQLWVLKEDALYWIDIQSGRQLRRVELPEDFEGRGKIKVGSDGQVFLWQVSHLWQYDSNTAKWEPMKQLPSHVTEVAQDDRHRLWVSTQSTGVVIYDAKGHIEEHLLHAEWDGTSLQSNQVDLIFFEPWTATMWVAYNKGGLSVCRSGREKFLLNTIVDPAQQDSKTDVLTFAKTKDGQSMWIGLENRGVYQQDSLAVRNVIRQGTATALYTACDGSLWTGLYLKGLFHRGTGGRENLYFEGSSPYAITEDGKGHLFVALLSEGLWQLNLANGTVTDMQVGVRYVFDLEYHEGILYAATTEGFYMTDCVNGWKLIDKGNYRSIVIDRQGYIWLLGGEGWEGLTIFDPQKKIVETPFGLKSAPLKNMSIDEGGRVWIATPAELLMLKHHEDDTNQFERYSFNINPNGQDIFYNYQASAFDCNSILWLGTTAGYQCVDTKELLRQTEEKLSIKRLVMGALSINSTIVSPGEAFNGRQLLTKDIVFTHELDLNYTENNLVIECALPYDDGFETDTYFYQLSGHSDAWYPMDGMTIVLSNLPPGDYELLTRTQSSRQSLLTTIHIAPPLWQTWWAYTIYLLIMALAAFFMMRYFRNKQVYQSRLREMKLKQEQQEQMNMMKQRFFTNISHDLRTPLSLIITPVEELLKQKDLGEKRENLEIVHRNAQHLLSLVGQILDFRRLESGNEQLHYSYGDIVMLERDVCDLFRLKAEKEKMVLDFVSAEKKIETLFDRDKMTKVMMNLLSNAFKFTPPGGYVRIRIEKSDGVVVTTVTDSGIGISDEDKAHVFERFYQSDGGTKASMGSGIGLHIVREYLQLQGGNIMVGDNPDGAGTEFRFTIPLRKPEDESGTQKQSVLPLLLIVDDNKDMLTYMSKGLSTEYRVVTASNGAEALKALEHEDVDIIISDVMMPEMDGLEMCRHVKTNIETSHVPVVLLTAKTLTTDELEGLEAGADDYITKPFNMDILRQRVHKLLERSRVRHERFVKEIDIEPSEIAITSLDEQFIAKAISVVEAHISESDFGVEELSGEMGVHRAQLYKKLEHLTGKSPQQFIRILRLKRGKQLLEQSGMYVSEVAYQVGFNSPRIFSKYFKEEFGVTPKELAK